MDLGIRKERQSALKLNILEKGGKKANIGEIRTWKGIKYIKTPKGWDRVKAKKKTFKEEFIDEDTGEVVTIEREIDDTPAPRKDSPAHDRAVRKLSRASKKKYEKNWDHRDKVEAAKERVQELKGQLKRLMADMEQEAEPEGGPISDRYGGEMNALEEQITQVEGELKMYKHNYEKSIEGKEKTGDKLLDKEMPEGFKEDDRRDMMDNLDQPEKIAVEITDLFEGYDGNPPDSEIVRVFERSKSVGNTKGEVKEYLDMMEWLEGEEEKVNSLLNKVYS